MVLISSFTSAVLALALAGVAVAHPGETYSHAHMKHEIASRDNHAATGRLSLDACAGSLRAQQAKKRALKRRSYKVQELREKRRTTFPSKKFRRDLSALQAWETVNHNLTGIDDFDMFTAVSEVFGANTSCILAPEVTSGPYYVVGEYMRSNVKESRYCDGVDLFLEVQFIDINTCEGVPDMAIDIWNANATGTYSGISIAGNYAADGYNSTYLRGIQLTDHDGVVSFETIVPGHYDGRATHTHLLAHMNATVSTNGTISILNSTVTHIAQLFYPETLRSAVEATDPYTKNTQPITSNDDDMWSIVQADASYDPFPQFLSLGEDIDDGLFAWIQIGVNASADYSENSYYAVDAYFDADGGHPSGTTFPPAGG